MRWPKNMDGGSHFKKSASWWKNRFVTLMVIPERTRQVHKVVVPFFMVKFGLILFSLSFVFLLIMGIDYIQVLGRIAENKRLKGENFRLRQEMQLIRNKVESMEATVERVRNYAKKLQIITGQGDKAEGGDLGPGALDEGERIPASKRERHSFLEEPPTASRADDLEDRLFRPTGVLDERVQSLATSSQSTEVDLSKLYVYLMAQSAIIAATPSLLPIAGWITSPYGYRRHPLDGSFRLHSGVDIAADPGTPVRAPAPGLVTFAGYREGYGKVVVINHGYNINTIFAHLSKTFVNSGDKLKRGETIAEVGNTGHSTGPHLHYEIRKNGVPVNPHAFMSRSRF